jgi:acetyl esterase/lipase
MGWYADRYTPNGDRSAPLASPVFATLADLPPLLIQVGSHATCGATRRAAWTRGGR